MRLTLRTLLAYLDDTLEPAQARIIGQKVAESGQARDLMEHIKQVTRRRRMAAPPATGPGSKIDPNTIAEYLDGAVSAEQASEVEQVCLASDVHLAEIAACHQILALVLGEPALVPPTAKSRMYGLVKGPESIHFRKPTNLQPADNDGVMAGDDVDETLRMGLPFLGDRGKWTNVILLIATGLAASVLLFLAIYHVLQPDGQVAQYEVNDKDRTAEGKNATPPRETKDNKDKKNDKGNEPKENKANDKGEEPKGPGKDKDTKGVDKGTGKPPMDINNLPPPFGDLPPPPPPEKEKPAKVEGKETKIVDKGTEKKDPDLPPPPFKELPPPFADKGDVMPEKRFTRPDNRPRTLGKYVVPPAKDPSFVVTRPIGKELWTRLFGDKVSVDSGATYVSLPGYRSDLLLSRGLQIALIGNLPEFDSMPIMESAIDLHSHDSCVDLTLLRGRILLMSAKDSPVAVRVRFENPNSQQPEFADLLLEKGAQVVVDRFSFFPPPPPGLKELPKRTPPDFIVAFLGVDGTATIRFKDMTHYLTGPVGKTRLTWGSSAAAMVEFKDNEEPIPSFYLGTLSLDRIDPNRKKFVEAILNARSELSLVVGTKAVDVGLAENLLQKDPLRRMLVVRSDAALGFVDKLIDTLKNPKLADAHPYAIGGLQHFLKSAKGNDDILLRSLTVAYSAPVADMIDELLRGNVRNASLLVDNLDDDNIIIREVSYFSLIGVPGGEKIAYDPVMMPSDQRVLAQRQWRALLKKLDEAPKK